MKQIAALYVDPKGPYFGREGIDAWDETRDARLYDGPDPVVAHPPCGPWSRLRHMNRHQDPMCAIYAVRQVRQFGGVLEHPRGSMLWRYMGLPAPGCFDAWGCTIEVNQMAWGHACAKPTWLYLVRVDFETACRGYRGGGIATHIVARGKGLLDAALPVAHAALKRRTPPAFADYLISLARSVK